MDDSPCARLMRAFETLRNNKITPVLKLTGSTGVRDWDICDYRDHARVAGTPSSWVGAHIGAEETGGGFWDADTGWLRFRGDRSPVQTVWFWLPSQDRPTIGQALVEALQAEGFATIWPGGRDDSVRLVLEEVS